jgi:hypothetical protein
MAVIAITFLRFSCDRHHIFAFYRAATEMGGDFMRLQKMQWFGAARTNKRRVFKSTYPAVARMARAHTAFKHVQPRYLKA